MNEIIQTIAVYALPVLFAITLHEAAHAYAAKFFGDTTAFSQGRMSLNPAKHIDPFGTIILPVLVYIGSAGNFLFGSAKPVPVNWGQLRHPKRDMALVAAAGPAANLLMALLWALVAKASIVLPDSLRWIGVPLEYMGQFGIVINIVLMVLNLLPLPPLDGGRVAVGILPRPLALPLARLEPFGMLILVGILILLPLAGSQFGLNLDVVSRLLRATTDSLIKLLLIITGNS